MARLSIRNGSYVVRWSEGGKDHTETLGRVGVLSQKDAEAIAAARRLENTHGYRILHRENDSPLFGEWAAEYVLWHQGQYPASNYRVAQIIEQYLVPFFEARRLVEITPKLVEQYIRARKTTSGTRTFNGETKATGRIPRGSTIDKELRHLKAIINKAIDDGRWKVHRSPIKHVEMPKSTDSKPPHFFEKDEMEGIYWASPEEWPMWKFLANTGLRRSEWMHLAWPHVGAQEMKVLSDEAARTKSGKWRFIPLNDEAQEALRVIRTITGGQLNVWPWRGTLNALSMCAIRRIEAVGLQGSIHTFRHTYISHLVMAGVDLVTVQYLAGHADHKTTLKYAHLAPGHLRAAADRIGL